MLKTFQAFKQYSGSSLNTHALSDEEIRATQTILLAMMDDFAALCREHGLTYFFSGGSALGAVRENGFIPWDDDIDIIMPREDYDRLPRIVEQECSDRYWVQSIKTSEVFDLCFAKFRKKGTKYVELFESEPERAGFFLDVFPLEDTYDNPVLRFANGIVDEALFFIASCVRVHQQRERLMAYFDDASIQKTIRLKAAIGTLFDRGKDRRKWYKRCEKWQSKCKNPNSRHVTVSCGRGHYFGEMYLRDKLLPPAEHVFEGRHYYIPGDAGHLLRKLYGDGYMLPGNRRNAEKHSIVEWNPGNGAEKAIETRGETDSK